MSIQSEIDRIANAKAAVKAAIEGKGVTVPDGMLLDGMAPLIESIEAGGGYEITTGSITPSETTTSLSWEHGLSTTPSLVLIYLRRGWSLTKYMNVVRMSYQYIDSVSHRQETGVYAIATRQSTYAYLENSVTLDDVPFEINETTVTAGPCRYAVDTGTRDFVANKSYAWMCIAGDVILS